VKMTNLFSISRYKLDILLAVVGICALMAGCTPGISSGAGGNQPPQATQPPAAASSPQSSGLVIDACALLTRQDVETALGKSVGDPMPENFPGNYSCKYEAADLDNLSINVIVYDTNKDAADAYQMELDINKYTEVSGIGDRALRASPIFDITVLKGRYELSIGIFSSTGDEESNYQKAKTLAEKALARLP
jgi:Protein of unknown function (DUF3558)